MATSLQRKGIDMRAQPAFNSQPDYSGAMATTEESGRLSPIEQSDLSWLNAKTNRPYVAFLTLDGETFAIDVMAPDACAAVSVAIGIAFPAHVGKPTDFKIKVCPALKEAS